MMSEALQKVAGNKMRTILAAMTSNRVKGVITGLLITTIIQSSSATTVMVVSFVNAGLLDLVGSIGVIMGANVGTTFTAWLISILGFKVSMVSLSLPLIGLSLPLLFSAKTDAQELGRINHRIRSFVYRSKFPARKYAKHTRESGYLKFPAQLHGLGVRFLYPIHADRNRLNHIDTIFFRHNGIDVGHVCQRMDRF